MQTNPPVWVVSVIRHGGSEVYVGDNPYGGDYTRYRGNAHRFATREDAEEEGRQVKRRDHLVVAVNVEEISNPRTRF